MTVQCENGVSSFAKLCSWTDLLQKGWPVSAAGILFVLMCIADVSFTNNLRSTCTWLEIPLYLNLNHTCKGNQCLSNSKNMSQSVCESDQPRKQKYKNSEKLTFCDSFSLGLVISKKGDGCETCVQSIRELDKYVQYLYTVFEDVMERYDCNDKFSAKGNCTVCKVRSSFNIHILV